ncbi:MAG: Na+/Ca+ antiporter, CaCA family [Parcubacteria group bacterium GW2011_GWD2_42_14]|nr:MAG: Na+/Ca+ antiporter, CaCA family [Parcubacteria group bacterium GW2011_GWD2_42_14]
MIYFLFILGFFLLIKGADFLVDGSASIARKLAISPIVIGLTIVAFGTSAPEFIVNIFASINGNTEIAIGNILGSNIVNILFILGISAIIYPIATKRNTVWKEIPLSLLAAILLGVMANDTLIDGGTFSGLTRIDGIVLLAFFIIFLYYTFGISKVTGGSSDDIQELSYTKSITFVLTGLLGLVVGGKWIVDGAVVIAENFNVSQSLIGLTIVAIGTSLPELATSAIAAYKKQTDIAIGNVVGSNIFNIFWILGFSALIRPLPFSRSSDVDILMTILASAILFFIMFVGKKHVIERWQGVLMVLLYISYVAYLVFTR